jgi:cyanophycinase
VLATAAREAPDAAVRTARGWFSRLGMDVGELRVRTPADARDPRVAAAASDAGLFYLSGGDPGRVASVLRGSLVWNAILAAWREGAALAGSSAGAMAMCEWTLVRESFPRHTRRRPVPALCVLPRTAFLPHFDTFGNRWIPSAQATLGDDVSLLGVDERTAAVWREGAWTAMGAGTVTVVRGASTRRFSAGEPVDGLPQPEGIAYVPAQGWPFSWEGESDAGGLHTQL